MPRTVETGCGLWHTPNVANGGRVNPVEMTPTGILPNGKKRQVGLEHQVRMVERQLWPTPSVCGNYNRKGASLNSGDGLATAVKLWPTPKASASGPDYARMNREGSGGDDLATAVARGLVPSPGANDWRSGKGFDPKERGHSPQLRHLADGQLNPTWVEWLMGFPLGWTE